MVLAAVPSTNPVSSICVSIFWFLIQVSAKRNTSHTSYYHHFSFIEEKETMKLPSAESQDAGSAAFIIGKYAKINSLLFS